MRVSIDRADRGFSPLSWRVRQVYLDGEPLPRFITADDELGLVRLSVRDESGRILRDVDGTLLTEWHRGRVEIELIH
jgi:hypothetical protein